MKTPVITSNPAAHERTTEAQFQREIEILNTYFVSEQREKLVWFRYKSVQFWDDISHIECPLVRFGDIQNGENTGEIFNACPEGPVKGS